MNIIGVIIELVGIVVSGGVAIIVCHINNKNQNQREREAREEHHTEQLNAMQAVYTSKIEEIKDDYSNKLVEVHSAISDMKNSMNEKIDKVSDRVDALSTDTKHSFEMTSLQIKNLETKQDKYNHLQERTFTCEQNIAVQNEQIKHLEKLAGGI